MAPALQKQLPDKIIHQRIACLKQIPIRKLQRSCFFQGLDKRRVNDFILRIFVKRHQALFGSFEMKLQRQHVVLCFIRRICGLIRAPEGSPSCETGRF